MEFTRKWGFPKDRIVFVHNFKRKFATYNTMNAAYNFCGEDDIAVKYDQDDELIGHHAIGALNAGFGQNPDAWLVYATLVSYNYGQSHSVAVKAYNDYLNCAGTRRKIHLIGPLAGWRVKLIRSIPLKYHLQENE